MVLSGSDNENGTIKYLVSPPPLGALYCQPGTGQIGHHLLHSTESCLRFQHDDEVEVNADGRRRVARPIEALPMSRQQCLVFLCLGHTQEATFGHASTQTVLTHFLVIALSSVDQSVARQEATSHFRSNEFPARHDIRVLLVPDQVRHALHR